MTSKERFQAVLQHKKPDKPPVWIMRQAGRTLPEYHKVREKYSFLEICKNPDLATQITLQPIQRFNLDAAIIFSDILILFEALNIKISYENGIAIEPKLTAPTAISNLPEVDVYSSFGFVSQLIQQVSDRVGNEKAVLGFSGAPYTLATYMIEGGSSHYYEKTKSFMRQYPEDFHRLMEKLTLIVIDYLSMQLKSGATAVQLFDTWAGELTFHEYQHFVLPYIRTIGEALSMKHGSLIYYINGVGNQLENLKSLPIAVLGIDWRISLAEARKRLGNTMILQGNLDPTVLLTNASIIRNHTFSMLDETNGERHIVNLGHGILPQTPIDNIVAFVQSVEEWAKETE